MRTKLLQSRALTALTGSALTWIALAGQPALAVVSTRAIAERELKARTAARERQSQPAASADRATPSALRPVEPSESPLAKLPFPPAVREAFQTGKLPAGLTSAELKRFVAQRGGLYGLGVRFALVGQTGDALLRSLANVQHLTNDVPVYALPSLVSKMRRHGDAQRLIQDAQNLPPQQAAVLRGESFDPATHKPSKEEAFQTEVGLARAGLNQLSRHVMTPLVLRHPEAAKLAARDIDLAVLAGRLLKREVGGRWIYARLVLIDLLQRGIVPSAKTVTHGPKLGKARLAELATLAGLPTGKTDSEP